MSRDKNIAKRAYAVRGAASKRKLKRTRARSGDHSRPGFHLIAFCPTCGVVLPVGSEQRIAACKNFHTFTLV